MNKAFFISTKDAKDDKMWRFRCIEQVFNLFHFRMISKIWWNFSDI